MVAWLGIALRPALSALRVLGQPDPARKRPIHGELLGGLQTWARDFKLPSNGVNLQSPVIAPKAHRNQLKLRQRWPSRASTRVRCLVCGEEVQAVHHATK